MIYCDASMIVAALTSEVHSEAAREWLRGRDARQLAASRWVAVEVASALAMKHRRGLLDPDQRRAVWERWESLWNKPICQLPIADHHYTSASLLVDAGPAGLRAGDSLHLAIVVDHHCALVTYDRDLAAAARARGVEVHGREETP